MTFQAAFPDFPAASLPTNLAALGFADTSWRNDACPSFTNAAVRLIVYIDFPDASVREIPESCRFNVYRTDNDGGIIGDFATVASDDWADVERIVEQLRIEAVRLA